MVVTTRARHPERRPTQVASYFCSLIFLLRSLDPAIPDQSQVFHKEQDMRDIFWNERVNEILKSGRSLANLGVRNFALSRAGSLIALSLFQAAGIAVLGGDVYLLDSNSIEATYDNWHCDQGSSESDEEFLKRSITISKDYIQSYSIPNALFAIVPKL
jgi:hypothetical protein